MATVNAVVLKHHKKQDGTWNVKICVNHQSKARYIETNSFVTKSQLDTKGKLKQSYVDRHFSSKLSEYRDAITRLGSKINFMTVENVREFLQIGGDEVKNIDIIKEFSLKISSLKNENKIPQSYTYTSVMNHLMDYTGDKELNAMLVSPGFLIGFEKYLRQDKTIVRNTKSGGSTELLMPGIKPNGIINYMSYFRTLFGEVQKKYNNPNLNVFPLPVNPFDYYDFPKATVSNKRNLTLEKVVSIYKMSPDGFWENIARDLFMLSFYLCGMNPKDMYVYLTSDISGDLEYARSKVKNNRKDGGVTNILIPEEADLIISKYAGMIQERYVNNLSLNQALSKGWSRLSKKLGFKCTMYYARHSFSNIARQVCKFSKDDVSFALNHKYGSNITEVYLDPDWTVVHKVQMGVLEKFRKLRE